jgi:undecaprenyl-diphosphatase
MIGSALIVNAIILFSTQYFHGESTINGFNGIKIGIMQAFALIPGISRSGITVSSGYILGLKKNELLMFAMMLSLPAILGAAGYEFIQAPLNSFTMQMGVGFIVAVFCGLFALHLLVKSIKKGTFYTYWSYCLVLGIIMLFN